MHTQIAAILVGTHTYLQTTYQQQVRHVAIWIIARAGKSMHPSRIKVPFVRACDAARIASGESNAGKLFPSRGAVIESQGART